MQADSITINDGVGARTYTKLFTKGDTTYYTDTGSTPADDRTAKVKSLTQGTKAKPVKFRQWTFTRVITDANGAKWSHENGFMERFDDNVNVTSAIHDAQVTLAGSIVALSGQKLKLWNGEL